jgi:hypothetical protein
VGDDWGSPSFRMDFLFLFFITTRLRLSASRSAVALLIFILFYCYERTGFHFSMAHRVCACSSDGQMSWRKRDLVCFGGFVFGSKSKAPTKGTGAMHSQLLKKPPQPHRVTDALRGQSVYREALKPSVFQRPITV